MIKWFTRSHKNTIKPRRFFKGIQASLQSRARTLKASQYAFTPSPLCVTFRNIPWCKDCVLPAAVWKWGIYLLVCTSICVYPDTWKDIFRINSTTQNTERRPGHIGTWAPRWKYLVVTMMYCMSLDFIPAESSNVCETCCSSLMLTSKQRFSYVFDWRGIGFMQGSLVGHIPLTLLLEWLLPFARVKRGTFTEAKQQNNWYKGKNVFKRRLRFYWACNSFLWRCEQPQKDTKRICVDRRS